MIKKSIQPVGTPVGSDVHKRRCNLSLMQSGKLKRLPPIDNSRDAWLQTLAQLPPDAEIALEVSTSSYFVMSVLEEADWRSRSHWVHTAKIETNRKQKYDRLDADRLTRKLAAHHLDPLPEAWFPPPPIRVLRLNTRQHCWLSMVRAQGKNRVQSLLQMHGLRPPSSDLFGRQGRQWLQDVVVPDPLRKILDQMLRLHDTYTEELITSDQDLEALIPAHPQIALLDTLPGVGPLLAALIWSEIGDLSRFDSASALANYTGLITSFYQSAETMVSGSITRQGSAWLRWALITAANVAIQFHNPFAQRYRQLRRRKRANVAKAAVARSLARCAYGVLKHGEPYDEKRWGRKVGALEQEA